MTDEKTGLTPLERRTMAFAHVHKTICQMMIVCAPDLAKAATATGEIVAPEKHNHAALGMLIAAAALTDFVADIKAEFDITDEAIAEQIKESLSEVDRWSAEQAAKAGVAGHA